MFSGFELLPHLRIFNDLRAFIYILEECITKIKVFILVLILLLVSSALGFNEIADYNEVSDHSLYELFKL
jgi:hypothetical protein